MQNTSEAISRRIADPDYQARLLGRSMGLNIAMAFLVAVMAAHSAYVWVKPVKPLYFFVDGKNLPRPAVALDSPIVDEVQMLQWTVTAVQAPYNINYHDFPEQLNTAGLRFSVDGWNSFAAAFTKSGNLDTIKRGRMLCYAMATRAPVINKPTLVSGRLTYEVQFPMVQTCQNTQQESTQNMVMVATVMRTDSVDHPDGLVVERLVAVQQ